MVDLVLNALDESPSRTTFRQLQREGKLAAPDAIGRWIAELLLDRSDADLNARPVWEYGNAF